MSASARIAVLAAGLLSAASAQAFCRTTTCDPKTEDCLIDAHGCTAEGTPLHWEDSCIELWLPAHEEPIPGVTATQFTQAAQEALSAWSGVGCGAGPALPGMEAQLGGHAECSTPGFVVNALRNINSVTVVKEGWEAPESSQVALTTLSYDDATGQIFDADIELNAQERTFTVGDDAVKTDLRSALTHEIGHLLGLAHSDVRGATMAARAAPGSVNLRTLTDDDAAGICASYPPDAEAAYCGAEQDPAAVCDEVTSTADHRAWCSAAAAPRSRAPATLWLAAVAIGLGLLRRRAR